MIITIDIGERIAEALKHLENRFMAFEDKFAALESAVTDLQSDIGAVVAKLSDLQSRINSSLSAAQIEEFDAEVAKLRAAHEALQAAVNPAPGPNPNPEPEPEPAPEPAPAS